MNYTQLVSEIKRKKSFLCVGLDTDITKIPQYLLQQSDDAVFEFNKQIIDATLDFAVAYKPNLAFYEAQGPDGLISLEKTVKYINNRAFTIADAKRGDIGNTAEMYAKSFFEHYGFDSVTIAPYMGYDSVEPFLKYKDKWSIVLGLTSNKSAEDFQLLPQGDGLLYETVLKKFAQRASKDNLMFVAGATRPEMLAQIRKHIPDYFLLVPGVGAQGGSLQEVCQYGLTKDIGLLINSSRQIIYAGNGADFAEKARQEAKKIQQEMQSIMEQRIIS